MTGTSTERPTVRRDGECVPGRPIRVPGQAKRAETCVPTVYPNPSAMFGSNPGNGEIRPPGPDSRCALGGIRTPGRLIRSQVLYPD